MDLPKIFDEHHAALFRFAYRLTGSVVEAEDIVQECFLALLRPGCQFEASRTSIRAYLFGVVRNQALKRRVKAPLQRLDSVEAFSPEDQSVRCELENAIARAVLELPDLQREVLILAHYEQMPLAEIAAALDIAIGAVKSRLQRARAALREALAVFSVKR